MSTRAADVLVETLALHGVDRAFCVPGESYIAVLDALVGRDGIHMVTCRHEAGAGLMAVADARLTGRAGTAFVSRGPGATNASIAVHTAQQDALPLVLFIGQIERKDIGRGAFQEVDYRSFFADMAKSVEEVTDPERLAEVAARAYHVAESGTPGPAVVSLPEDMLEETVSAAALPPRARPVAAPGEADVAAVAERLAAAERPVLIAGGALDGEAGRRDLLGLSEAWALPVATSFKHQDMFPNEHPNFAGHLGYGIPPALGEALAGADLVLAVGTRLGDVTSQGFSFPHPGQPLVHVYPDAAQIGRNFPAEGAIVADPGRFVARLAAQNAPEAPTGRGDWIARLHQVHAGLAEWKLAEPEDGVDFGHVVQAMAEQLPEDAVIATDAGNFNTWLHRYFPFKSKQRLVSAVSGAMGLGVPGAVAAALRHPERPVVALAGDGGFLMTGNELATAVKERARLTVVVSNNASYGTIRTHQEKKYPGRKSATDLVNPDFAMIGRAFGAVSHTVTRPEEAGPALRAALAHDGVSLIEVRTSLRQISAYAAFEHVARAN